MSKPITRRSIRPITRRVPNPEELRRALSDPRGSAAHPPGERVMALEKRIQALEEKLDALVSSGAAPAAPPSLDEIAERALEARLDQIAAAIEAAAAQRAIDALGPRLDELVAERMRKIKPSIDPRTILELVDQRLKGSLDPRFRS